MRVIGLETQLINPNLRKPPSFPRTREPREKQITPFTLPFASEGDPQTQGMQVIPVPPPVPSFPQATVIPADAGTQRKTNHAVYPPLRKAKGTRSAANAGDARGGDIPVPQPVPSFPQAIRHSRKPPSFPRTREPREKQIKPFTLPFAQRRGRGAQRTQGMHVAETSPSPTCTVIPASHRHSIKPPSFPRAGTQRKTNQAVYPPLREAKGTRSEANAGDARGGVIPSPPPVPSFRRKPTLQQTERPSRGAVRRRCPLSLDGRGLG